MYYLKKIITFIDFNCPLSILRKIKARQKQYKIKKF